MLRSFKNAVTMIKASWAVLKQDKELLALPVIGGVVSIVVGLILLVPFAAILSAMTVDDPITGSSSLSAGGSVLGLIGFLIGYMLIVLINQTFAGAIVHGTHTRLTGGDPTIATALSGAFARVGKLAPWAVATGTVGLVLDQLRDMGFIGKIIAGIIDFAWKTVTFVVLPILIIEGLSPKPAFERSRQLMTGRYGDSATATFGFGIFGFLASLVGVALIFLGATAGGAGLILTAFGVIWLIAMSVLVSTMTAVFRTVMYMFLTTGSVPAEFAGTELQDAFA